MRECKTPECYNPVPYGQDYCKTCRFLKKYDLGGPREKDHDDTLQPPKEETVMPKQVTTEKRECTVCHEMYIPTGNRQQKCGKCGAKTTPKKRREPRSAQKDKGDVVQKLLEEYNTACDRAKCCFVALRTIEDVTGSRIDIPALELNRNIQ